VLANGPNRGDVVLFRRREDDSVSHVQRVIGLPGDEIQITNGVLIINGAPVKREQLEDAPSESPCPNSETKAIRWREILPSTVAYEIFQCKEAPPPPGADKVFKVPAGQYFMLGDNRDNSMDSRFSSVGFIPSENITGQLTVVFLSIGHGELRFDRLGKLVH
jgi:signal peptidase I